MASLSAAVLAPAPSGISSTAKASSVGLPPEAPRGSPGIAQVRYLSPVIEIDPEAGLALLQVRDVENGKVRFQLPPERVVREYKSVEAATSLSAENSREAQPVATAADAAATSSLTSVNPAEAKQA